MFRVVRVCTQIPKNGETIGKFWRNFLEIYSAFPVILADAVITLAHGLDPVDVDAVAFAPGGDELVQSAGCVLERRYVAPEFALEKIEDRFLHGEFAADAHVVVFLRRLGYRVGDGYCGGTFRGEGFHRFARERLPDVGADDRILR